MKGLVLVRGKAERLLVLLSLLQHHGGRTGTELAACRLLAGAESWPALELILGRIDFDFVVEDGAQKLLTELDRLARRYTRAATDVPARAP